MSKARLVITAVTIENRPVTEVASYGVPRSWSYELLARYRDEGETAFEPRSRRPHTTPGATDPEVVDLVLRLRKQLSDAGHDADADTLGWLLTHHHDAALSRATIHRILTRHGAITPEPKKKPKSAYIRFEAMPNETWQSDFTHYPLTDTDTFPKGIEIITWLDDCTRYALHVSAHRAITTPVVKATFRKAAGQHGIPASTLTDNGMVYTVRLAGHGTPRRPQRIRATTPRLARDPDEQPTEPPHNARPSSTRSRSSLISLTIRSPLAWRSRSRITWPVGWAALLGTAR